MPKHLSSSVQQAVLIVFDGTHKLLFSGNTLLKYIGLGPGITLRTAIISFKWCRCSDPHLFMMPFRSIGEAHYHYSPSRHLHETVKFDMFLFSLTQGQTLCFPGILWNVNILKIFFLVTVQTHEGQAYLRRWAIYCYMDTHTHIDFFIKYFCNNL